MGTRGFIGFVVDGAEKIAYNHWDSYPSGLGESLRLWLTGVAARDELGVVESQARALRVVDSDSAPTDVDIEILSEFVDTSVGARTGRLSWYQLLRKTQGEVELILEAGVVEDASEFPADSLFAEWGYVIDFDQKVFEVYKGFQKAPHVEGRFAGRKRPDGQRFDYYPVRLVHSWPLTALPATTEEFIAAADPRASDEE